MRLFLLPISTRRTLIYCERIQQQLAAGAKPPIAERITNFASSTWASWEKAEKGWRKWTTNQGNQLLKRIPYEEWGLKTIPPATQKRLKEIDEGKTEFECLYPGAFIRGGSKRVSEILKQLGTERQSLHRRRIWTCVAWMPVTIPFQILPVIPNLPFYYLAYRTWSHYRALYGGKLLGHIVSRDLVKPSDSQLMDELYTAGLLNPTRNTSREAHPVSKADIELMSSEVELRARDGNEEVMLLQRWNGKLIAEAFKLPEMEVEIERAVEQVESAVQKTKEERAATEAQEAKQISDLKMPTETEKVEDVKR